MLGLLPRWTVYVLVAAVLGFAAVRYVPVYLTAIQFRDAVRTEVRFAGTRGWTVAEVEETIGRLAQEYAVPLPEEGVKVTRDGPVFDVEIRYSVPIDLRVYRHEVAFEWQFLGETFAEE